MGSQARRVRNVEREELQRLAKRSPSLKRTLVCLRPRVRLTAAPPPLKVSWRVAKLRSRLRQGESAARAASKIFRSFSVKLSTSLRRSKRV